MFCFLCSVFFFFFFFFWQRSLDELRLYVQVRRRLLVPRVRCLLFLSLSTKILTGIQSCQALFPVIASAAATVGSVPFSGVPPCVKDVIHVSFQSTVLPAPQPSPALQLPQPPPPPPPPPRRTI
eukprot:NODE_26452_length_550_cov_3.094563.p1 GENE.NODE_26452_length_550_cov_3.094563~~NODE_26452_length_550_cov_3.094563.p1  ORF type:complete len:124 (+),score=10.80 NODE_26452_length_550_cov_3.094563:54-425(+)